MKYANTSHATPMTTRNQPGSESSVAIHIVEQIIAIWKFITADLGSDVFANVASGGAGDKYNGNNQQ
jgi:hypothetical protein